MSDNLQQLLKNYHVFYEVSPEYVELEERPVGLPGEDSTGSGRLYVDVYGIRPEDNEPVMPPADDYALAYAKLQKLAERVSQHTTDSCSLEVIPFSSVAIIDNRGKVEAMLRLTISHERGLDQPAGPAEARALEEVEKGAQSRGCRTPMTTQYMNIRNQA